MILKDVITLTFSELCKVRQDVDNNRLCGNQMKSLSSFDRVLPTIVPTAKSRKIKWKLSNKKTGIHQNLYKKTTKKHKWKQKEKINAGKMLELSGHAKRKEHGKKHFKITQQNKTEVNLRNPVSVSNLGLQYAKADWNVKNLAKEHNEKDPSTYWSNNYEFRVPNVANPFGNVDMPLQHDAQMNENSKYLKLLQNDIQKQINIFNKEVVEQQPVSPDELEFNTTEPLRLPEEELEKYSQGKHDGYIDTIGKNEHGHVSDHYGGRFMHVSGEQKVTKNHWRYGPYKGMGKGNSQGLSHQRSFFNGRDLIGNMNLKDNMDQLKKLMGEMKQTIDAANNALQEKQKKDQEEEEKKDKNKEKTSGKQKENK